MRRPWPEAPACYPEPKIGDTVGVCQIIGTGTREPLTTPSLLTKCRCGREIGFYTFVLKDIAHLIENRLKFREDPYGCLCKHEVNYWEIIKATNFWRVQNAGPHSIPSLMSREPEYEFWDRLRRGCCDPTSPRYKALGRKGYSMCSAWKNAFDAFISDVGYRPSPDHVILIDSRSHRYCKKNCRWVTQEEFDRLNVKAVLHTFDGESKSLAQWAREFSAINRLHESVNRQRIVNGWTKDRILGTPVNSRYFISQTSQGATDVEPTISLESSQL